MKKITSVLSVLVLAVALGGCGNLSKKDAGTLAGAGVGAAAGYAVTGGAVGTAAGAVGGGYLGRQLAK